MSRLIDAISRDFAQIQEEQKGRRRYVRIQRQPIPPVPLSETELSLLRMCRDFPAHLLGRTLFDEVSLALLKHPEFELAEGHRRPDAFGTFRPGTIDYSPHYRTMKTILQAMEDSLALKLTYCSLEHAEAKVLWVQPLKMFSHRETVFLHARLVKQPGKSGRKAEFDPLLAIHRIQKAELTGQKVEFPADYDFEAFFNRHFGVMKGPAFEVEVQLHGWAARYVAERTLSPDQRIVQVDPETIRIIFQASSEKEVLRWLFSFQDNARLIRPESLVAEARAAVERLRALYKPRDESMMATNLESASI